MKILTDNVSEDPTYDFQQYSDAIVSMITDSEPQFTVGVYGKWGTGKTTLMKMIENSLKKINEDSDSEILTVWFNAWRYEREEQFATIALMKTIAYSMMQHPRYHKVAEKFKIGLKTWGKDVVRNIATNTIVSKDGYDDMKKAINLKLDFLNEVEQDTIYFDGLKKIEDEMNAITADGKSRVVIFIDDLDRCSPKKALEVFESVKVFLDMKGFVYVIGLSHETISKLISAEYEKSGINGEHYIQKIIQIPIRIPSWNTQDIENLIEQKIAKKLDEEYGPLILNGKDLIAFAVDPNPRELKQFINNLIVSLEIFSEKKRSNEIKFEELIVIEAIKTRWNNFYSKLWSKTFRDLFVTFVNSDDSTRIRLVNEAKEGKARGEFYAELAKTPEDFIKFLEKPRVTSTILGINHWESYRRVSESVEKISPSEYQRSRSRRSNDLENHLKTRILLIKNQINTTDRTIESLRNQLEREESDPDKFHKLQEKLDSLTSKRMDLLAELDALELQLESHLKRQRRRITEFSNDDFL